MFASEWQQTDCLFFKLRNVIYRLMKNHRCIINIIIISDRKQNGSEGGKAPLKIMSAPDAPRHLYIPQLEEQDKMVWIMDDKCSYDLCVGSVEGRCGQCGLYRSLSGANKSNPGGHAEVWQSIHHPPSLTCATVTFIPRPAGILLEQTWSQPPMETCILPWMEGGTTGGNQLVDYGVLRWVSVLSQISLTQMVSY